MNEKLYSNQDIAEELGISVQQLMAFMLAEGLVDENGRATKYALTNGILVETAVTYRTLLNSTSVDNSNNEMP